MHDVVIVQIRIVADSEADAQKAIEYLISVGAALSSAQRGRKGGWLAYGTLSIEDLTDDQKGTCEYEAS